MYNDIPKDIFVNRYKKADMIKDCANFLKKIEKLKPFLIEFNEDSTMRSKMYFSNCIVRNEDSQPIIMITYDKFKFLANNKIHKA